MRRRLLPAFALLMITAVFLPVTAWAESWGIDISFPQCGETLGHYKHGVVGVNDGGDFEKNPCLKSQVKLFDNYFLYVDTNYPSNNCAQSLSREAAYHCGYNAGRWDVDYASSQGAYSNLWFLDVETGPTIPWSPNKSYNAVFLYGLGKGIQSKTNTLIGYYATSPTWHEVAGSWPSRNYGYGIWYPTGSDGRPSGSTISDACHSNYTGASAGVLMYQYIVDNLDHDDLC